MLPEAVLSRYLKVRALAEQGMPGERDAARSILAKMESEYPGVRVQAERWQRTQQKKQEGASSPPPRAAHEAPPGVWPKAEGAATSRDHREDQRGQSGNWENIFQYARTAFNGAYGFAETIANAVAGRTLAEQLVISSRVNPSGFIAVTIKLPLAVYQQVLGLNAIQKTAFRQSLHEQLDEHLDRLLGE